MDNIILGIVWFVLLGFLPGFVLIGIFRLKDISWVKGLLYIIGLSLMFDMVVGFGINLFYPMIGLVPFNPMVMRMTWIGISAILLTIVAVFNINLVKPYRWDNQWVTVLLIYIGGVILIYQTSLLTNNLVGSDIHLEYYYAQFSVLNGFSNISTSAYINICLPITILVPMYSVLSGIEVMWVFKIVQPLVLAILPVILYKIFKLQFGRFVGILSVIFFVTLPFFTMDIVQLIRQQYAMIFFGLVTLVLMGRRTDMFTKVSLGSIFGIGVVVSHYGVGVGFMGYMIAGVIVILLLKIPVIQRLGKRVTKQEIPVDIKLSTWKSVIVWVVVTIVCVGGGLTYYKLVGSSVGINYAAYTPVLIGQRTVNNMVTVTTTKPKTVSNTTVVDGQQVITKTVIPSQTSVTLSNEWQKFFDVARREPLLRTAVGFDFMEASTLGKIWRVLLLFVELCIIVGLSKLFFRPMPRIRTEYFVFIISSVFIVIGLYTLPTNGFGLGAVRVLIITLMFLSPFFIFGLESIAKFVAKISKVTWRKRYLTISLIVVLLPYIMFNSGLVFELIKSDKTDSIDIPFSPALSGYRLDMTAYFADEDVDAMEWVKDKISKEYPLFGDWHSYQLAWQYLGEYNTTQGIDDFCKFGQGYVFLRKWNVDNEKLTTGSQYGCRMSYPWLEYSGKKCESPMTDILSRGTVVFDNGSKIIKVDKEIK